MRRKSREDEPTRTIAGGWVIDSASSDASETDDARQRSAASIASDGDDDSSDDSQQDTYDNVTIVLFGVFGGLYLLYSWWWIIVARAYSAINAATADGSGIVGGLLQQIVFWVTPFAPLTWFLAAMLVSRGKKPWVLGVALLIGAIILVPLPMITGGGAS